MLAWLRRRLERGARVDTEAEALIRDFGEAACSEARERECVVSSIAMEREWSRVALAIAGKCSGFHAATWMATDANFASSFETFASPSPTPVSDIDPPDEQVRPTSRDARPGFRIHFLAAAADRRLTILQQVEVRASDVSTAIRESAHIPWPSGVVGFRLVDHDGREVLGGHDRPPG